MQSPGSYHKRFPPVREQTPDSRRPVDPGSVTVHGPGWRATVPAVVITGLLSALGGGFAARSMPTPTTQDNRLDQIQQQLISSELKRERELEESRREFAALRDANRFLQTQVSMLEVQIREVQKR